MLVKRTNKNGDYEVGRGKPPKEHQFKPGQSGNLKGRPAGSRCTAEEVKHHLDGSMTVRTGGTTKKMNRRAILVHGLFERAVKGDNRAAEILLRHEYAASSGEGLGQSAELHLTEDDLEILRETARRLQADEEAGE